MKPYESRTNTNFHDNETPKEGSIVFVGKYYKLILFLKWVKTIIHWCSKNCSNHSYTTFILAINIFLIKKYL